MNWTAGLIERETPALTGGVGRVIRMVNVTPTKPKKPRVPDPSKARKLFGLEEVPNPWGLTPAQVLILGKATEGLTSAEIAESLGVTKKNIDEHLKNTYARMGRFFPVQMNRVRAAIAWDRFIRDESRPRAA